jgi:broad specificity phosphatase PhoE
MAEIRFQKPVFPFLLFIVLLLPAMLHAQADQPQRAGTAYNSKDLIQMLQKGGYVIYLRHAETNRNEVDVDRVNLKNCKTQRNLSEKGRQQSIVMGQAFRALGIKVAKVVTSPYCRSVDTGKLAFGEITTSDNLRTSVSGNQEETESLAAALRRLLASKPPQGVNNVIVAHSANLKDATGIWAEPEGVAVVFQPNGDARFSHLGSIRPQEWTTIVRLK